MTKLVTIYSCTKCDTQSSKWAGRCLECGVWGTLIESTKEESIKKKGAHSPSAAVIPFSEINHANWQRIETGIKEIDQVLGGGIVPGSLILLGGEPGVGKSTLMAQIAIVLAKKENRPVLYCSGEESGQQIKLRLDRILALGETTSSSLLFAGETQCEKICATIQKEKPTLAIVDSIQTIGSSEVESEAGSISQVRACTVKLLQTAKENDIPIIITGHVTKEGSVAGPKTLEHLVDTVLYLEGDSNHFFRLLKTVKNRFGSTNEVGVFEMTEKGLMEVANPSSAFITEGDVSVPGTCTTVIVEGSRAFLVNVQALTSKTYFGYPQRRSVGFDQNRLQLLIAVLVKRLGLNLGDQDIHINIVGGLKINEPAIDLAVCASIISAYKNKPCDPKTIFCGEVGLSGEVRQVSSLEKRLKEAERLGFTHGYIPASAGKIESKLLLIHIRNVRELEI
ncbi:DNA repair protein RadA [Candidatus Uhrbacteria bacterium]|nr:DNA repair protein RadA [Candidatus Uhrbacteria bacterium]